MNIVNLSVWSHDCFYAKLTINNKKESFLIDTWFSSYLCLSNNLKPLFPDIDTYATFKTEYTLADSSKKEFKQYSIPKLKIWTKTFEDIYLTFNQDENIIWVKLLEELWAKLEINSP